MKRMMSLGGIVLAGTWLLSSCPALEIHVPGDYPTIQEGIDAIPNTGGSVIVAPGVYSPATNGERYPLIMKSAVFLKGEEGAELSADEVAGGRAMIVCDNMRWAEISGFIFNRYEVSDGTDWSGENRRTDNYCDAVSMDYCSRITIGKNRFDGGRYGTFLLRGVRAYFCEEINVIDNKFIDLYDSGIRSNRSSLLIRNNIFQVNHPEELEVSDGVRVNSWEDLSRTAIQNNHFDRLDMALNVQLAYNEEDTCFIENNRVSNCTLGLKLDLYSAGELAVRGNTITGCDNHGIYLPRAEADYTVVNNIITECGASGINVNGGALYPDYNDVWGNGENYQGPIYPGAGSISEDPLLVAGPQGNYYLEQAESPCVDAGHHDYLPRKGETTSIDHRTDSWPVDMGYHYPALLFSNGGGQPAPAPGYIPPFSFQRKRAMGM